MTTVGPGHVAHVLGVERVTECRRLPEVGRKLRGLGPLLDLPAFAEAAPRIRVIARQRLAALAIPGGAGTHRDFCLPGSNGRGSCPGSLAVVACATQRCVYARGMRRIRDPSWADAVPSPDDLNRSRCAALKELTRWTTRTRPCRCLARGPGRLAQCPCSNRAALKPMSDVA